MEFIIFKSGYQYQLHEDYTIPISIKPPLPIRTEYIRLSANGVLTIKEGYCWDGPSGLAFDTLNFMRGSLVHDSLYQLMREGCLNQRYRELADKELQRICLEDGMSTLRAWWVYRGVRLGGGPSAEPSNDRRSIRAPR